VLAVSVLGLSTGTSARMTAAGGDIAAQRLALEAGAAASDVAAAHHGSFDSVSLLSLHKGSLVAIRPSASQPWLSGAAGTAHAYSLTVTAPDGDTYTITRYTNGGLSGTCHVAVGAPAGNGCEHTDASGAGVW
jgi:hypothetical protein